MKPSEVLDKAADWLSEPGRWTQGAMFLGKRGTKISTPRHAQCACALGSIQRITEASTLCDQARRYLYPAIDDRPIICWNDEPGRTQEEVVAAFRKAAELAKADDQ